MRRRYKTINVPEEFNFSINRYQSFIKQGYPKTKKVDIYGKIVNYLNNEMEFIGTLGQVKRKNKKGFMADIIMFSVIVLIISLMFVIFSMNWSAMKGGINSAMDIGNNTGAVDMRPQLEDNISSYDTLAIIMIVVIMLGMFITAVLIPMDSIFLIVMILFMVFSIPLTFIISNIFSGMQTSGSSFANTVLISFPKVSFLMDHLPMIWIPISVIFIFLLISKMVATP